MFTLIRKEPVRLGMIIRAAFLVATAFGLKLTTEQVVAIQLLLEAVLLVPIRGAVTPNTKVDELILKNSAFQAGRGL